MAKIIKDRIVEVRINDIPESKGSYLLANYPNEFEAMEAAKKAVESGEKIKAFAFIVVVTTIGN